MIISIIACVQLPDYGVGFKNQLLFSLKEDMKRFKELTRGHPIIMGRSTWDSLPKKFKPLPGRTNFVLTEKNGERISKEDGIPVKNIDEAIFKSSISEGSEHIFIIGGTRVWEEVSKHVSSIYLTECEGNEPADAFFPSHILESFQWKKRENQFDQETGRKYSFVLWERK